MFNELKVFVDSFEKKYGEYPFDLTGDNNVEELKKYGISDEDIVLKFFSMFKNENNYKGICLGYSFMNINHALSEIVEFSKYYEQEDSMIISNEEGKIKEDYYNPNWLPVAEDGSGNFIGIDLDPGQKGTKGQVINFGTDDSTLYVLANSFEEFLKLLTHEFESNRITIDEFDEGVSYVVWNDGIIDFSLFSKDDIDDRHESHIVELPKQWEDLIPNISKPYTTEKLEKVKVLSFLRSDIVDIAPLKYFTGCKELILSGIQADDFTALSKMHSLKKLYVAKTSFDSVSALKELSNLKILCVSNTKVNSLDGIENLTKLADFSMENISVPSVLHLGKLKKLKKLDISGSKGYDLSELHGLVKLKELTIDDIIFENYDFLSKFTMLETITLGESKSNNFSALCNLNKLRYITCSYEIFKEISPYTVNKISYDLRGELSEEADQALLDYVSNEYIREEYKVNSENYQGIEILVE